MPFQKNHFEDVTWCVGHLHLLLTKPQPISLILVELLIRYIWHVALRDNYCISVASQETLRATLS